MMKRRSLLIILAALLGEAVSLTCPPNYRPNGSTRCLYVVNNQAATATSASCGSNFLVDVQDQPQYTNLKLYLQVQGTPNSAYWTRYRFSAQNVLTPASTVLSNSSVFNGTSSGNDAQCVAIQQQGLFVVTSCSTNLPFICVSDTQALTTPTAILNATLTSPTTGSNVTLTCVYSNSSSVSFQKDDVTLSTTNVSLMASPSQLNLTLASIQAGRYDCVASNPLGAVKSTAIVVMASSGSATVISPITVMLNGVTTNTPVTLLPLGTMFTLSCSSSSSGLLWTWFRNGLPLTSPSSNSLNVSDFNTYDTSGFYQCRALDPTSNSNAMGQLLVLATDGVSGPVASVISSSSSQTGVVVNWAPPSTPNTDQSLLRYTVTWCDSSSAQCNTSSGVAPVTSPDPSLGISTPFTGQMAISQLQPGSQYNVQVGVVSPAGGLVAPLYNVSILTFGTVPNSTVQIFNVSRTQDNTTIVAFWQPLVTTPPTGQVVRYYVEYRDATKGTSNVVYVTSAYNYIVLQNLLDANNYEIRVRAAVQISSNDFEQTAPSNWTFSSGVTPFIPSIPPTSNIRSSMDPSVVVPAVIVPVFVVAVIAAAIVIFIWFVLRKSKSADLVDGPGVLDTELIPPDSEADKKPMLATAADS